jgi:3-methyl-2-oxobutanoate hydroxymethyltransferase
MKIHDFALKKKQQEKITMLTCYDFPSARIAAQVTELDCILVGDTLAEVVHGHSSTVMATMEMMILHTQAVARGLTQQFLIADIPFLCHRASQKETVHHVKALIQAGAHAVKMEGCDADTCKTIAHIVLSGVPVMGHLGLTPQSVHQLGGYKVQGREPEAAELLLEQAFALQEAGCFALVLECVPQKLATSITQALHIPTIGIGAGSGTDGQVLVWHDMLGLQTGFKPKFVKQFAQGAQMIQQAIEDYAQSVKSVHYPSAEYMY